MSRIVRSAADILRDMYGAVPSTQVDEPDVALQVTQAALLLGITAKQLRAMPCRQLPFHRTTGGHRRYLTSDVVALRQRGGYLKTLRTPASADDCEGGEGSGSDRGASPG